MKLILLVVMCLSQSVYADSFFGDRLVDAIKTVSTKDSMEKPVSVTHTEFGTKRAMSVGFADVPSVSIGLFDDRYTSGFGDLMIAEYTPKAQISAQYGILDDMEVFTASTGTVTVTDNMFTASTGTGVGGYGVVRSAHPVLYREGQGLMSRFTAIFDSANATATSLQAAGMFNLQDTIAFGYNGADFGVIFQHYGAPEIRSLTITAATSGNLTLTLNGVAHVIALTSGTNAVNAHEIAKYIREEETVWNAQQVGDTVIFQASSTGAKAGTYSVSGAGISATFAAVETGADKTTTFVAQSAFSEGAASWLVPGGLNVYMIQLTYLGFGPFKFFAMNPGTGQFELVHIMHNQTLFTKPSLSNRALKVGWISASLGSTTNLTVKGASAGMFISGKDEVLKSPKAIGATNSAVGTSYEHILTVKANEVFNEKVFLGLIHPVFMAASTDSTKDVDLLVIKNASFGINVTSYNYLNSAQSAVSFDDTGIFTVSEVDQPLIRTNLGSLGSTTIDLDKLDLSLALGETLSFFGKVSSGANSSVTVNMVWKEDI